MSLVRVSPISDISFSARRSSRTPISELRSALNGVRAANRKSSRIWNRFRDTSAAAADDNCARAVETVPIMSLGVCFIGMGDGGK